MLIIHPFPLAGTAATLCTRQFRKRVSQNVFKAHPQTRPSMLVRLAPAVFVCLWATGFVGAKFSMPHAEPASFLSFRYVIAFGILATLAFFAKAPWPRGKDVFHAMIVGALVHGVYLGSVFWSVRNGMPGGVSAVIVGLQPLLTAIMAGFWLKEQISGRHWAGLAVGMVGVLLVLGPKLDVAGSGINPDGRTEGWIASVSAVPEPSGAIPLVIISIGAIGWFRKRRILSACDRRLV